MKSYVEELEQIKRILKNHPMGLTVSEISEIIKVNRNSVAKYLDVLAISCDVEMRVIGPAKLFFLSKRIPISAMMNQSNDNFIVLDNMMNIIDVNNSILAFIKKNRDDVIGKKVFDLNLGVMSDKDKEKLKLALAEALNGKENTMEMNFTKDDIGYCHKLQVIPTKLADESNGMTIIGKDITEQKNAVCALKESETRFRELADQLPEIIFETDMEGNFTFANFNAFDVFGYTKEEFDKGLNVLQMVTDEDKERAMKNIQLTISGKREAKGEQYKLVRKDGTDFLVSAYINNMTRNNKIIGMRGILISLDKR